MLETYPKLAPAIEFHQFDEHTYLIQQKQYNHQIRVGRLVYEVLIRCDGRRSAADIVGDVQASSAIPLNPEDVSSVFSHEKIVSLGFLESEQPVSTGNRNEYLKISTILLRKEWLHKISWFFKPLFQPTFFYLTGVLLLGVVWLSFYWLHSRYRLDDVLSLDRLMLLYGFLLVSTFFHEMGHIAACRRFGAEHGGIGFGFYLLTPVFFADVSDAWKLKPSQRIIMDLAGIYMELIVCTLLIGLYLLTGHGLILHAAFFILLHSFVNLNPLLRYDGYWALSDALNLPNLRTTANRTVVKAWRWLRHGEPSPLTTWLSGLLLVYGLLSWIFIVLFMSTVLFSSPASVLYFPANVGAFMAYLVTHYGQYNWPWMKQQLMLLFIPTMFYYLLWQLIRKHLINWKELIRW